MRLDMTNTFNEGKQKLNAWKQRYTPDEYPFKVTLNIFYRQYTMNAIWDKEILGSFKTLSNTEQEWLAGYRKIEDEYSIASSQFTVGNRLIDLMNQKEDIGGINYTKFEELIRKGKLGDRAAIEEIEFSYLYYYLTNKAINIWASFGRTGQNELEAISTITGAVIELNQEISYPVITNVLGQLGIAKVMNDLY